MDLEQLSRKELQQICKNLGMKANGKVSKPFTFFPTAGPHLSFSFYAMPAGWGFFLFSRIRH